MAFVTKPAFEKITLYILKIFSIFILLYKSIIYEMFTFFIVINLYPTKPTIIIAIAISA